MPSDTSDPCIINETFGIFVSPLGSDSAAGTQLAPVSTVGHAMDLAKAAGKRVYACGSAGSYTKENLVVGTSRDGVSVYGGLDCTSSAAQWAYNASDKANVAPSAAGYALQVTGLSTGLTFEDFGFTSVAGTTAGQSSIAVFASSSTGVVLRRCNVQAGAGVQGQDQNQPPPYSANAPSGNPGSASLSSGLGTGAGGPAISNSACTTSVGGAGGSAKSGEPASAADGQPGQPGASNAGTSADCNLIPSQGGGVGGGGSAGTSGAGATVWASFTSAGWTPTSGTSGGSGTVGEGGGGGGAGGALNAFGGAGGGGAGGCGGAGGPAAGGGGSSIALLTYDSTVNLDTCTLSASNAGRGGNGAAGQAGQTGGAGGSGNTGSCGGGGGGPGGPGGPGGGGAGGVSAGAVWFGTAPTITAGSQTFGTLGAAGKNGNGTITAIGGTAAGVVQFP